MTVTHTELRFGYSAECAAKVIDRSQITTVEVKERIHGLCDWGGYGIRKQLPSCTWLDLRITPCSDEFDDVLTPLPLAAWQNKIKSHYIRRGNGLHTKERTGHPCDNSR